MTHPVLSAAPMAAVATSGRALAAMFRRAARGYSTLARNMFRRPRIDGPDGPNEIAANLRKIQLQIAMLRCEKFLLMADREKAKRQHKATSEYDRQLQDVTLQLLALGG